MQFITKIYLKCIYRKEGKVIDYFGADLPNYRYRTQLPWHGRKLSLRNALELTIAYSKALASFEKAQFFVSHF